jgi:hypothetical protein
MQGRNRVERLLSLPPLPSAAGRNAAWITAILAAVALAFACALALPGASFTTFALWDPLIFIDNAYRLQEGQFPHREFHTPLGALTALIPYLGLRLGGSFAATLPTALAVVLLAAAPVAIYILATRLRLAIALPFGAFLLLLIASPMLPGGPPSKITMALWYNRTCWVLLSLLFTLYLPPYRRGNATRCADGVVAALLILVLVYTKITYGLVALAFPLAWAALERDARRPALIAAGLVIAAGVACELRWGLNRLYLADIAFALRAGPALRGGIFQPIDEIFIHAGQTALAFAAALLVWWVRAAPAREYLFMVLVFGASVLVTNQNTHDHLLVCVSVIIVVAAERLARHEARRRPGGSPRVWPAALVLLLVFIAQPAVYHTLGLYRHAVAAASAPADPTLPPALRGFVVAEFKALYLIADTAPDLFQALTTPGLPVGQAFAQIRLAAPGRETAILSTTEYFFMIRRGIEALAGIDDQGGGIFVFDATNPFNFLLGRRPPVNTLFAYDLNRQFSKDRFIPAEATFAQVSLALVPKFQVGHRDRQALEELYGAYLRTHFAVARETPYWTVWRRREPPPV